MFEYFPKDVIFTIALKLDISDIYSFCQVCKKINNFVTNNKYFWIERLKQDYNVIYLEVSPDKKGNPKEYYKFFLKILYHNIMSRNEKHHALVTASENGHLDIVKYLVEKKGVSVKTYQNLPLQSASSKGYLDIVRYLVEKGADVHGCYDLSFKWACKYGHLDVVNYLVKKKSNIHVHDEYGLRWASKNGHLEVVRYLVEKGADIHAFNDEVLKWAISGGHLEVVKYLVENGANSGDFYAVIIAKQNGHMNVAKYLENLETDA